jgi:peptidoglycan L-alanyl-D-glutamate endopeptidase CwlK
LWILQPGDSGDAVRLIQDTLNRMGYAAGPADGDYGPKTQAAVSAFQRQQGLAASGSIDTDTLTALGFNAELIPASRPGAGFVGSGAARGGGFGLSTVQQMFPDAPKANISRYLPMVLSALEAFGLGDNQMTCMALATIRAETAGFVPISEMVSKYNTAPGGRPFGLYDFRKDLGNQGIGDGDRFKGRGFIQLTGRFNYKRLSVQLNMGDALVENPDLANAPDVAAQILAAFLKNSERAIRAALQRNDLAQARKLVNGGSHGLDRFELAYNTGANAVGLA